MYVFKFDDDDEFIEFYCVIIWCCDEIDCF